MFGGFGGGNNVNVRITGDASQLRRETQTAQRDVDKFGQKTQRSVSTTASVVKGAMALGAGAAVAKFAKDTITAASDLQESNNAIQVMFGESAEAIGKIGESSADSFGLSQRAFNEFAVRFSAFADTIADSSGQKVVDVVEEMTGRVADFASVHNVSLERAAEVAQSTLAGETEVFRRFGGDVSAARVEAKLLEEGIVDTGQAITEQDKVFGRYLLFMEQTEDTAGDFKNTQDDLANATRTATAKLDDFQAMIGGVALPVLGDFVQMGSDTITVLEGIASAIPGIEAEEGGGFGNFVSNLMNIALLGTPDALAYMADWFEDTPSDIDAAAKSFSTLGGEMNQIPGVMDDSADASSNLDRDIAGLNRRLEDAEDAQREAAQATRDATLAMQEQIDKLRAMSDPFFGALQAVDDLEQAQRDYKTAVDEGDLEGQEDAIRDIAAANIDLKQKFIELKEQGIDPASDAGKNAFRDMGLTEEQISLILRQFQEIEDNAPYVKARVEVPNMHARTTSDSITWERGEPNVFHRGGTFRAPTPGGEGLALLQDREKVIPADQASQPGMNGHAGGGEAVVINVNGFVGSELQLAQEIDRLLTRRRGTSGLDFER